MFFNEYQTEELFFRHAQGKSVRTGKEFHPYHEIFFLLGGNVEFISETHKEKLPPYTTVIIPKKSFHQFIIHGDENAYCRCVFNFEKLDGLNALIDRKLSKILLVQDDKLTKLFLGCKDGIRAHSSDEERNALLKAFLSLILVHINGDTENQATPRFHPLTSAAINLINQSSDSPCNATDLAEKLRCSVSYLSHVFKADMQIPLYKYILEKKLLYVHDKIQKGETALNAALDGGFNDYSGFYRQYKRFFGYAPSNTPRI